MEESVERPEGERERGASEKRKHVQQDWNKSERKRRAEK